MMGSKWLAALASIVLLAAGVTRAAAPDLPPESIGADTIFVIHADARHLSPDLLRTAANVVLGDNADRAKDFIARFQERYDKLISGGVESITVIGASGQRVSDAEKELDADPNAPPARRNANPPVVYFHLNARGDSKIIEQVFTKDLPEKQKAKMRFEQMDNWVVMHEENQKPPEKEDAARTRAFSDALGTMTDASVAIAFIPDERLKKQMNKGAERVESPKVAREALPALSTSKWVTLAIALGNNPGATASANTADPASAKQLDAAINDGLDDLKQQAGNGEAGAMIFLGPIIQPLVDALKPTTSGNVVTVKLQGEPLTLIANLIATFRPPAPAATQPGTAPKPQ